MMKGIKIVMSIVAVMLVCLSSMAGSIYVKDKPLEKEEEDMSTVNVVCILSDIEENDRDIIVQEMSKDEYSEMKAFIIMHKESFMTILSNSSTDAEIKDAEIDTEPFFQSLLSYGLTDKNVSQLKGLCRVIREKAESPRESNKGCLGMWGGVYTPIYGNIACSLLSYANHGGGYALGTHSLLPTVGADFGIIWRNSHWAGYDPIAGGVVPAQTLSEGLLTYTLQTGGHLGLALGFIGLLLGVLPSGVIFTGLLRSLGLLGFATIYVGCGILPG